MGGWGNLLKRMNIIGSDPKVPLGISKWDPGDV